MEVREDERRRISRELHDELGQQLSALKMALTTLSNEANPDTLHRKARQALHMVDGIVAASRRIAADLRPQMLDDLGLSAAIEWLSGQVQARSGLEIRLQLDPCEARLDERQATALFRMVQEALTNVERHAKAHEVRLELLCRHQEVLLTVSDDGVGFSRDCDRKLGSHGLLGLRERARMLGGSLHIDNMPGGGASLCVRLPLKPKHALSAA